MHNLCNITSENLFTKTLTRSLKKDPSTVFSACDLDKLGKSAPLERAPKRYVFIEVGHGPQGIMGRIIA